MTEIYLFFLAQSEQLFYIECEHLWMPRRGNITNGCSCKLKINLKKQAPNYESNAQNINLHTRNP